MTTPPRATKERRGLLGLAALTVLVLSGLGGLSAGPANAAAPCWKKVLNDWFVDGRIDGTYPIVCYTEAQQHIGDDAKTYSSFGDVARRALLAAIRGDRPNGPGGGGFTGGSSGGGGGRTTGGGGASAGGGRASGGGSRASGGGGGASTPSARGGRIRPPGGGASPKKGGPVTRAIEWLGPSNAESIPLPLLVLAGIALLLLAAAAASFLARRIQARRLRPVPAPSQGPKRK